MPGRASRIGPVSYVYAGQAYERAEWRDEGGEEN
jgi:hypothetical protein